MKIPSARLACIVTAFLCSASGCVQTPPERIEHWVLFSLASDAPLDDLARDCERLRDLPGVMELGVGRPLDQDRPEVDRDYQIALRVVFTDALAYRTYLDHPLHRELVRTWGPRFEKVRIFDHAPTAVHATE